MNIHSYQKKISDLLLTGRREPTGKSKAKKKTHYSGVYLISRTLDHNLMKLGEAHGQGGLYDRIIGQYKICMSLRTTEFFLRYLVICPSEKEGKKFYSQIMEKEMLKTIDGKVEDSYSKEYVFNPSIKDMEGKRIKSLKSHTKYYDIAIKFEKDGFRKYNSEKGFNTPLQNFDNLPSLNDDVNLLLELSRPRWVINQRQGKCGRAVV